MRPHTTGINPARRLPAYGGIAFLLLSVTASAEAQTAGAPLEVSGVRVVFFGPSRAERDSIVQNEGLEIDDIIDDFNLSAGKTAVYLGRWKIASEFTDCRTVIVRTGPATYRTFDRRSIPDPVGMILTDGLHEPRVVPGRGSDRDLILQIDEYFHLHQKEEE